VAPAQLRRQDFHLGPVRPDVDKPDHVEQVRPAETCSVIGSQLSRQRRDNLFALPGALLAEDIPANPVSDAPVEKYQLSIDGLGSAMACSVDERSKIGDESAGDLRRRALAWVGDLRRLEQAHLARTRLCT
jgi:hypothetical protein